VEHPNEMHHEMAHENDATDLGCHTSGGGWLASTLFTTPVGS
jgi:hypothetical protein